MFTIQASYNIKTKIFVFSLYLYIFDGLIHRSQVISAPFLGFGYDSNFRVLNKQNSHGVGLNHVFLLVCHSVHTIKV